MNVLVLCHGNVCRSPAAEAVLKSRGLKVQSAGLKENMGTHVAMKKIRDAMEVWGYDLSEHRSQPVEPLMVTYADIILIMDIPNKERFRIRFPKDVHKLKFLGEYLDPPVKRIKDPGFMKRGLEVNTIVEQIVLASVNFTRENR